MRLIDNLMSQKYSDERRVQQLLMAPACSWSLNQGGVRYGKWDIMWFNLALQTSRSIE